MGISQWFESERGIRPETLEEFGVEVDGNTARFPYDSDGVKTRKQNEDGSREFYFSEGMTPGLFRARGRSDMSIAFLTEGETDAMRLWQEFDTEVKPMVAGLSGINGWQSDFVGRFANAETVYVILDNDPDYKVAGVVDKTWTQIRRSLGPKAVRLRLPVGPEGIGVKDVCEFFDIYDLDTLRTIAENAPSQSFHFKNLDLKKTPPPVNWLTNNLLAQGDVCLMVGEPSIGKSWLSMALAVAVANEEGDWLGHPVLNHGRVLYVDEENPEDVIYTRLYRLGLDPDYADNVRYLSKQGIRLDKHPEALIDEAVSFDPTLIVLDSLTRLHTLDENNAGHMAMLFNDGINPLSRETGATILLLHHVNKSDSPTGFGRARGSGDITAVIDAGFDVRAGGSDRVNIIPFKSRRSVVGSVISAEILDTPDGGARVAVAANPVF